MFTVQLTKSRGTNGKLPFNADYQSIVIVSVQITAFTVNIRGDRLLTDFHLTPVRPN